MAWGLPLRLGYRPAGPEPVSIMAEEAGKYRSVERFGLAIVDDAPVTPIVSRSDDKGRPGIIGVDDPEPSWHSCLADIAERGPDGRAT